MLSGRSIISETNVDIMNVDVSTHDLIAEAQKMKCNCDDMFTLMTLFKITTTILLCLIFFWIVCGNGVNHFQNFVKKRGTVQERLDRDIFKATKRQQKLESKKQSY